MNGDMANRTIKDPDAALAEFRKKIAATPVMAQMHSELENYPLKLMRQIIKEYEKRKSSVPDHALDLAPLFGEAALRSLIESGLVEKTDDSPYAIHTYVPSEDGIRVGGLIL